MPLFVIYLSVIYLFLRRQALLYVLTLIALVWLGRHYGFQSLVFLRYLLNGFVFGYVFAHAMKRRYDLFYVMLFSVVPELVFLTLCTLVPHYRQALAEVVAATFQMINSRLEVPSGIGAMTLSQASFLFPLAELLKHVITVFILSFIFYRAVSRERPKFSSFIIPDWFIWVLASGLVLALLKIQETLGLYIIITAVILYLFNGIAIVRLFFTRAGNPRLAEFLFYLLQPGFFFIPLLFLGVFQTWIDFRKKIIAWEPRKKTNSP
jgi:hypothetical protein